MNLSLWKLRYSKGCLYLLCVCREKRDTTADWRIKTGFLQQKHGPESQKHWHILMNPSRTTTKTQEEPKEHGRELTENLPGQIPTLSYMGNTWETTKPADLLTVGPHSVLWELVCLLISMQIDWAIKVDSEKKTGSSRRLRSRSQRFIKRYLEALVFSF